MQRTKVTCSDLVREVSTLHARFNVRNLILYTSFLAVQVVSTDCENVGVVS